MTRFFAIVVLAFVPFINGAVAAQKPNAAKNLYKRCAACHLPNGAGVPSVYPPLQGHVPTLINTQQARDYLARVVIQGIRGVIAVNGQSYRGAMFSVVADLDNAQVAALLNDLVARFGTAAQKADAPLFSAADVKRLRDNKISAKALLALRSKVLAAGQ